jgi:O-antigen/teichoic acid export membrane protein
LPGVRRYPDFSSDGRMLVALLVGAVGYSLSFYETCGLVLNAKWVVANLLQSLVAGAIAAASLGFWIYLMLLGEEREMDNLSGQILSGVFIILLFILFLPPTLTVVGVILANLAVAVLSFFLFWRGRNELDRRNFWMGILLMILLTLSRFFEYRSGLILKSLAFIAAGVTLILGGLWFERKKGADE